MMPLDGYPPKAKASSFTCRVSRSYTCLQHLHVYCDKTKTSNFVNHKVVAIKGVPGSCLRSRTSYDTATLSTEHCIHVIDPSIQRERLPPRLARMVRFFPVIVVTCGWTLQYMHVPCHHYTLHSI
jgi:hypothetical protein